MDKNDEVVFKFEISDTASLNWMKEPRNLTTLEALVYLPSEETVRVGFMRDNYEERYFFRVMDDVKDSPVFESDAMTRKEFLSFLNDLRCLGETVLGGIKG